MPGSRTVRARASELPRDTKVLQFKCYWNEEALMLLQFYGFGRFSFRFELRQCQYFSVTVSPDVWPDPKTLTILPSMRTNLSVSSSERA